MSKLQVKIFGANLRDQSKGQHVVHLATCADCKKLEKIGENFTVEEHDSEQSVVEGIYSDMIRENGDSWTAYAQEVYFAPCVKFGNGGGK